MEAIVLAGGFGTRLRDLIVDLPKPMAPIDNRPFLEYLLNYLDRQNVNRVILSVGYKYEIIQQYFKNKYKNVQLIYSVEDEPLGTGGAIKKAFKEVTEQVVFIINGDTFFHIADLTGLRKRHFELSADITIALKQMSHFDRYGCVFIDHDYVIGFKEKKYTESGYINGGIYITQPTLFDPLDFPEKFSFENDFLSVHCRNLSIGSYICDGYFIDIGLPEDYRKANNELKKYL